MLKTNIKIKSMLGPNRPIAYPIGIVRAPSPIEAHIIKLAVLEFVTLNPNSPGSVINSANIEAKIDTPLILKRNVAHNNIIMNKNW